MEEVPRRTSLAPLCVGIPLSETENKIALATEGLLDFQGRVGITSFVRLRPRSWSVSNP